MSHRLTASLHITHNHKYAEYAQNKQTSSSLRMIYIVIIEMTSLVFPAQVANLHPLSSPVRSATLSSSLFFLVAHHFATRQAAIVIPHPAIITPPPVAYLGSWLVKKKYGVNQWETLLTQFAMAISAARFVLGRGTTVVSHEIWMLRPTKGPEQRRKTEKYLAGTLSVEIMMTAPTRQMEILPMMCQQCSRCRPLDQEIPRVTM